MKSSYGLFRVFGISVNIHITFILLPVFFLIYEGIQGLALILAVFACVTLHEFCHSLTAKRMGIDVRDITLFPIGGVASMSRIPESPLQEFLISIVGPLFNICLAGFLIILFRNWDFIGPKVLMEALYGAGDDWPHTIALIPWINIFLAVFNLIPAFPMDGGRVLRSVLAARLGYRRGTRIAVSIGHLFAVLFGLYGLLHYRLFLVLIAIFIYSAASSEEAYFRDKGG